MSKKHRQEIESLLNKSESGVNKRLQKLYKELADEITQDIIQLSKEIEETDKFSKKLQKERLEAIRSQMYTKANQLEGTQKENIFDYLRHDGHVAFNELFYGFEMTEEIPLSFTMLTDKQINVIINTPVANRKLSTRLKGNSAKMKQNLNRVLTRGFAKGLSTQKMAVQIAEIGGANYRRAMNIARTESGRVTSVARQQSQNHAKSIGLKLEKRWISTLDKLTRHTHQILDGKTIDIDAYFEVSSHKALQPHMFGVAAEDCNCRCRTITIVNGMGPELRKDNEIKEVIPYQNYDEWVAGKNAETAETPTQKASQNIRENKSFEENLQKEKDLEGIINETQEKYENTSQSDWKKERRRLMDELEDRYDDGEIEDDEYNAGLAELRERFKKGNVDNGEKEKLKSQITELKRELVQLKEENVRTNAKIIKEELSKFREMGISEGIDFKDHLTKPNSKSSKLVAESYDFYPSDWIKKSIDYSMIDVGSAKRAYYNPALAEMRLAGDTSLKTAIHEMAHRMESVNKVIVDRERAYFNKRTEGEKSVKLKDIVSGSKYGSDEITKVDHFLNPYMGKEYPNHYELLSMGVEMLYSEPLELMKDPDMYDWVIEMLLTV